MRLFLAVELPNKIKRSLAEQLMPLKKDYPYLRWVPEGNFHLTIHFFGDIKEPDKLIKKIEHSIYDIPEFYLYSNECGLFIDTKIVTYLDFRRNKDLERLVLRVEEALDIKSQKKYLPHVTFARYKIPSKQQYFVLKKRLKNESLDISFPVTKIYLFESILRDGKPVYKKVAKFPLVSPDLT